MVWFPFSATGSCYSHACCSKTAPATTYLSGVKVACVQPLGKGNYQKSSTRGAGGDAWTWRGVK